MSDLKDYSYLKPEFSIKDIKLLNQKILVAIACANELKSEAKILDKHFKKSIVNISETASNMLLASNSVNNLNPSIASLIAISKAGVNPIQNILKQSYKKANQIAKNFEKNTQMAMDASVNMAEINADFFLNMINQKLSQLLKFLKIIDDTQYVALEKQYLNILKKFEIGFKPNREIFIEQTITKKTTSKKINEEIHQIYLSLKLAGQRKNLLEEEANSFNFDLNCLSDLQSVISAIQFQSSEEERFNDTELSVCFQQIVDGSKRVSYKFSQLKFDMGKEIFKMNKLFGLLTIFLNKMISDKLKNPLIPDELVAVQNTVLDNIKKTREITLATAISISNANNEIDVFKEKIYKTKIKTKRFEGMLKSLNKTFTKQKLDLHSRHQKVLALKKETDEKNSLITRDLEMAKVNLNTFQIAWDLINKAVL